MLLTSSEPGQFTGQKENFEDLLLEISTLFINLPVESIDDVIEDTQRRICRQLDLDLSALWQWSDKDSHILTITHLHSSPQGPERPVDIDASKTFPWIYNKMLSGEILAFSTDELPEEAGIDKETRRFYGVESSVDIPLVAGSEPLLGILTFDTLHRKRPWNQVEVNRLKLVAEVFTNALLRKRSEKHLIESEARLSLAAESAEAGLWELDYKTGMFWTTTQARKIFNYPAEEPVSLTRFEKSLHSEDLIPVRQALSESFSTKKRLMVEYRIFSDSKSLKWICSKGRPYFNRNGSPTRMLGISIDITERKQLEEALKDHLAEIKQLKKQLEQENYYLREDLLTVKGFEHIIGQSKAFKGILVSVRQVASTAATVLLLGETGTGKGIIANAVHQMSDRKDQPFVTVNCAALPHNLIESELFGRDKGAFTGAHATQVGRFEVANRGTIFLDEIGEMPLEMQTKLLRVLQDGEFERLGSPRTIKADVRVIAATSRNLREDIQTGRFREDLFYRLNVFPITIPPLRQRQEDIPLLAQHFVDKYARKMGKEINSIPRLTLDKMLKYQWPGNVRELEHLIERSVITSSSNSLTINEQLMFSPSTDSVKGSMQDLVTVERDHIQGILNMTNWRIEGSGGAASILNIHPSTLRFRLKKLGIKRPA